MVDPKHDLKIDAVVALVDALLTLGGLFYMPLRFAGPVIMRGVIVEATKLKNGLADGTIVPDGHGGYVPGNNSRFDPKTGKFVRKAKT